MSIHLSRDLESLHRLVMSMCAHVEQMIYDAVEILHQPDLDRARLVMARDDEIDEMDVRIEEECLKLLALHQPVAVDLRRITTAMKISAELERVADLAVSISERACGIASSPEVPVPDDLKEMCQLALGMLQKSIDAYVQLDVRIARKVCLDDENVDELNRRIIADLTQLMRRHPNLVEPAMHLFSASRQIERIADHATNIAEDVIYLVEGEIVRHSRSLRTGDDDLASRSGSGNH
jgi:phosphate transport system protein